MTDYTIPFKNSGPNTKPVFDSPREARAALVGDKLGTVYRRADKVFVVTSHGSGTFDAKDWDDER